MRSARDAVARRARARGRQSLEGRVRSPQATEPAFWPVGWITEAAGTDGVELADIMAVTSHRTADRVLRYVRPAPQPVPEEVPLTRRRPEPLRFLR